MAVLINAQTRVICQGITGSFGAQHTRGCLHYGGNVVGGVTPGKGGTKDENGLPIFNSVHEAVAKTGADATMIFVPPSFAGDAILEAAHEGMPIIAAITEGIPVQDMIRVRAVLDELNADLAKAPSPAPADHRGPAAAFPALKNQGDKLPTSPKLPLRHHRLTLIGPNCPGVITPGPKTGGGTGPGDLFTNAGCKIGIMPGYIHTHVSQSKLGKAVGIVSRSGTLTYEAVWQTSNRGLGQSSCIGIGGDPVRGINHTDCLALFADDPDTHVILLIGEIGGSDEEAAADWIAAARKAGRLTKPVAAFIGGRTAPEGRRMGHAGAIIETGGKGTADSKIKALQAAGVEVAMSPADMGAAVMKAMGM